MRPSEITIIATGFVDRNVAPARVIGSTPAPQSHSIASAFAEAAGDKQEEVEAPKEPERPTYSNAEIFANIHATRFSARIIISIANAIISFTGFRISLIVTPFCPED